MSVVRWDRYHQEMLIEKVRERTCLWDIRHPDYRNTHKKQTLYEEIAVELDQLRPGTTVDDVRKRWANLRCQFSENIRSARGKPGEPVPERPRKLWCKEILMFLNDVTVPRSSKHRNRNAAAQQQQAAHENGGMGGPEGSITSDLEDHEVEDEEGSRQAGDFSQCGSNCEGGAVSPESCCFTPVRTVAGMSVVVDPAGKRKTDCLDSLTGAASNIVCTTGPNPTILPPLRPQDAIDKYALCVASELRQIRQPQQLVLAKWHIQNVLFQAQFGMLAGPPPPMAFSAGPTVTSPYAQDTIVNWQQSPPIQGMQTEGDSKEATQQAQQAQTQHRPPATQQDYVRSLSTV